VIVIVIWILIFLILYVISILGWGIVSIKLYSYVETIGDLYRKMCDFPTFVPIINTIALIGIIFELKFWDKIKDKKLPHKILKTLRNNKKDLDLK